MGYNRGMGVELCKFAGGKCDLCGDGNVCKRDPSVDMGVARGFVEGPPGVLRFPTCPYYESFWRKVFRTKVSLVHDGYGPWDGETSEGVVLSVHPQVRIDPSRWFRGGCDPVTTMVLEKNPTNTGGSVNHHYGIRNGFAVCHGVPFALNLDRAYEITRPVQPSYRKQLLNQYLEFQMKNGPIFNSR